MLRLADSGVVCSDPVVTVRSGLRLSAGSGLTLFLVGIG